MEIGKTLLTINGEPGESVRVLYRDRGEDAPPPIWEGQLTPDGSITIEVPHAYMVIIGSSGNAILRLFETKPSSLTVLLGKTHLD